MLYLRYYHLLFIMVFTTCCSYGRASFAGTCDIHTHGGYFTFDSSKIRFENRLECFKKEYQIINARRKAHETVKSFDETIPSQLIGLGMSGGGIKSSSFQLGLLSGLHEDKNRNGVSLLNEIDYIASVSGGSWANGAYFSANELDTTFFDCLDEIAALNQPKERCKGLQSILPWEQSEIWGSKDWQEQIVENYLRGKDVKMKILARKNGPLYNKPFPIFLSTHSNTIIGKKSIKNLPFEMTPLHIATIADCNSIETPCGFFRRYLRPLHWTNRPEKGFVIDLEEAKDIDIEIKKYLPNSQHGIHLSHAMWSSGGLLAKIFSLHLRLSRNGEKLEGIREKYVLSDGGKTDNIGLIPLVERGADLIILSQIVGDAKLRFGDLKRAAKQVTRLFDVDVDIDRLISPHDDSAEKKEFITHSCIKRKGSDIASVWLIKPTQENVNDFYGFLRASGKHEKVLSFLEKTQMARDDLARFPQNRTIKLKYPKKLIYAYYLLGKYIGKEKLSPMLNEWLSSGSDCKNTARTGKLKE